MHHWAEEWFDTLFTIGTLTVLLIFFLWYWNGNYQLKCAEVVLQEFLDEVSASGKISLDVYEQMRQNIGQINGGYKVEISCVTYELQPIYAKIPAESLRQYYADRNIKNDKDLQEVSFEIEEALEALCLQKETNASILAAERAEYIPLPEEGELLWVEAVRKVQEVYEGEELITLCRVYSNAGNYYVEAEPAYGEKSGSVALKVRINGEELEALVDVICYPRVVSCSNGHKVVNSEKVLSTMQEEEVWHCPFCQITPNEITGKDLGEGTDLLVVSENTACKQCGAECNERSFEDYIIFPYCINCMSETLLFTGNTKETEQIIPEAQIMEYLESEESVRLEYGDLVVVSLYKNERCESMLQAEIKRSKR